MSPVRVLLIDDDDIFYMHIQHLLKKLPGIYNVHWESTSEAGLQAMLQGDFDICLLDFHIDHVDGLELLQQYKQAEKMDPVIFLTGEERAEIDDRALKLGANDFLVKDLINGSSLARSMRYAMQSASLMKQLHTANQHYAEDLEAAARIQEALLPKSQSSMSDFIFTWRYQPSASVAGDIINYFEIDEHRLGMYCIDVSGHGVPAAMFAVQLSRVITPGVNYTSPEGVQLFPNDLLEPTTLLQKLNTMFPISEKNFKYFTILYAVIERKTGHVSFATAGHPAPFLIRGRDVDDDVNSVVEEIPCSGVPIGMFPDITYDAYDVVLEHGDSLLLYSDGIHEAMNITQEMYGLSRLQHGIAASRQQGTQICDHIMDEVNVWQDCHIEQDDCSLLYMTRL